MLGIGRALLTVVLVLFVSACTTGPSKQTDRSPYLSNISVPQLYLRGVFNWWGTVAAHQFKPGNVSGVWHADIDLVADGQPYDFKIADAVWTPSQSCGALSQVTEITTKSSTPVHCSSQAMNLRFTPSDNGVYRFTLKESKPNYYTLTVAMR
ncbi:hypothetical protein DRW07_11965 [Alteromonas sediminis]|uniref:Pullulanase n=1 Tax=Alteromonas sediminis TaxID=2259342 RepID=A0A3N5YC49_9ALTE|nr:hypothetical protein [Alteromonas sediminis]RPJ66785.1 hypothetical protein DRW07_11965 [Alteromonas sediminis]